MNRAQEVISMVNNYRVPTMTVCAIIEVSSNRVSEDGDEVIWQFRDGSRLGVSADRYGYRYLRAVK
jgi:hypothetical protein